MSKTSIGSEGGKANTDVLHMQIPNASTATKVIPTNAWTQVGGSRRVSTIGCGDDLRGRLSCHRYVCSI